MPQTQTAPTELGSESIGILLKKYAVPGIIAMTASSLYNMVDSIYIGHIPGSGSLAISGLAVTFPLMNLSTALGTLVGVGAATMISVLLGQRNYKIANKVLANEVTLNCIVGLLFTVFCLMFLDPILYFFGASANTLKYARDYMEIILYGNVITHLYFGLNSIIRSSGNPKMAMGLTLFTVILNSILDPIFIFTFGMGVRGAALATVICQAVSLAYSIYYFTRKDNVLRLPKGFFSLEWRIAKDSLSIGMGPFLMNSASCIVTMFINQQLLKYGGDLAIGAYGIINRINFLFIMVVMGFNQGMQPIAGYNYGAQKIDRLMRVLNLSIIAATGIMVTGWLIAMFLPYYCARMFTTDKALIELGIKAIRIVMCCFPIIGFQMVITNFFQCIGKVKISIFLSLSRQLLILLPLLGLLPLLWDIEGVWYSMPISDFSAAVIAAIVMSWYMKKLKRMHRENLLQQEMTEG